MPPAKINYYHEIITSKIKVTVKQSRTDISDILPNPPATPSCVPVRQLHALVMRLQVNTLSGGRGSVLLAARSYVEEFLAQIG